jgi:hypothetical protein
VNGGSKKKAGHEARPVCEVLPEVNGNPMNIEANGVENRAPDITKRI